MESIGASGIPLSYSTSKADIEKSIVQSIGVSKMEYPLSGIYILECDFVERQPPERFYRALYQRDPPDSVSGIPSEPLYLGTSNDVVDRIHKHVVGEGAQFTKLCPPKSIFEIYPHRSIELGKDWRKSKSKKEAAVAERLRSEGFPIYTGI
jgi:predicted GIY-YIG superfamily endonuclease